MNRQLAQPTLPRKPGGALDRHPPQDHEEEAQTSSLLIDDDPILVLPALAVCIGLNEAIVLQQVHYWLRKKNAQIRDGHRWVYNTYEQWRENFPFWSVRTIQRIFTKLEDEGLVITANFGAHKWDQTKWYRINYKALDDKKSSQAVEFDDDKMASS